MQLQVYYGLPLNAEPPSPETSGRKRKNSEDSDGGDDDNVLTTVIFRCTDTLADLHTSEIIAAPRTVDARNAWLGIYNNAPSTTVNPVLNISCMMDLPDLILVPTVDYVTCR